MEKTAKYAPARPRKKQLYGLFKTHAFRVGAAICVVLVALLLGWWGGKGLRSGEPASALPEKVVEVVVVRPTRIEQTVEVIGTIEAKRQTMLTSHAEGTLRILVDSGQHIAKGTLIARIENSNIDQNYQLLKESESLASLQYERMAKLEQIGVLSKKALEEKHHEWLEIQKKLSDAHNVLDDVLMKAPFDGVVGFFKSRDGSQLNRGEPVVMFYDPSSLIVMFDVPLATAQSIQNGQSVRVKGKHYPLTYIQKMLDRDRHMCPAYLAIDCPDCMIGSAVDVALVVQAHDNAVVIPFEASFLRGGASFVYVVRDGKAILTPVLLGIRAKQQVEVTSGLKEGDEVVAHGHHRLYPDMPVRIEGEDRTS